MSQANAVIGAMRVAGATTSAPRAEIVVDGRTLAAHAGECVAAALWAAGILQLRRGPRSGAPRGAFCWMGVCQACLIKVDGRLVRACMEPVRDGMTIELGG